MSLEISISDCGLAHLGSKKDVLYLIKNAGFDGFDAQFCGGYQYILSNCNYKKICKEIRKEADYIGLKCLLAHAPFFFDKPEDREILIKRSIECASILGAPIIVIHPVNAWTAEENKKYYQKFEDFAKSHNIKIALENMFNWDQNADSPLPAACSSLKDFQEHISMLNKEVFTTCIDIGHAEMMKKGYSSVLIEGLSKNVGTLHIHDNDHRHDLHAVPFSELIDFGNVAKSLGKINYSGVLNFEVVYPFFGLSEKNIILMLKKVYKAAIKIRSMIK